MMSNSNFEITNFTVDSTSQKISSIEINGEVLESGSSIIVEDNKAATINVSAYTRPVSITPTSGNDAMAKTTVTLTNIPSGGPTYLTQVTLLGQGEVYAFIENTDADETQEYINTFSGTLYVLNGHSLERTDYAASQDESGFTTVTIDDRNYTQIILGWE